MKRWWRSKHLQQTSVSLDPSVRRVQEVSQTSSFNEAIAQIQAQVSCPPVSFDMLYVQTLKNMAQLTRDIPHTLQKDTPTYFSYAVKQAVRTLMLRREKLLPKGALAEQIAEEDAAWTFAVFSSALCHGFIDWALCWCTQWCIGEGGDTQSWHEWSPASGGLPEEATHYRWKVCDKWVAYDDWIPVRQGFVAAQIVPMVGVQWLQGFETLWRFWWSVIDGRGAGENPLWDILRQAIGHRTTSNDSEETSDMSLKDAKQEQDAPVETAIQDPEDIRQMRAGDDKTQVMSCTATDARDTDALACKQEDNVNDVAAAWLTWVRESIEHRRLSLNQPRAEIFTVEEGWFVTLDVLQSFNVQTNGEDDLSVLVVALQEAEMLWQEEDDGVEIQRMHLSVRPPVVLQGVIVLSEHWPVILEHKPYRFLKSVKEMKMEGGI
jgi:hypothetical protein